MDFDENYYISENQDITTKLEAITHYCNFGMSEDRCINKKGDKVIKEFEYDFYVSQYSLQDLSYNFALKHWMTTGINEGFFPNENSYLLHKKFTKDNSIIAKDRLLLKNNKIYMVVSMISYPFGGGESYLLQTMKHMSEEGYECLWLTFQDKFNKLYDEDIIEKNRNGTFFKVKGGFTENRLIELLNLYRPDVVHTQGRRSGEICTIVSKFRIPVIMGYHFWMGLVKLSGEVNNRDIIENINNHEIDNSYLKFRENGVIQYVASEFINDVISELKYPKIENVVYPLTDETFYKINKYNPDVKYITVINICKLKGGEIILELIKQTKLPFLVIRTEPYSGKLDNEIEKEVVKNGGIFLETQDNMKHIYMKSRIVLLPSLVDETFCRVAYECLSNGIPVLTTGKGYIKYMIDIPELIIGENVEDWKNNVLDMYNNKDKLISTSSKLLKLAEKYPKDYSKNKIVEMVSLTKSASKNIMIITPWCDQGLGIQSRTYSKILMKKGYNVYIFSFLPYGSLKFPYGNMQKNPEEWNVHSDIYYSYNTREQITKFELMHFINRHQIGICFFPEICWNHVFEISKIVSEMNVRLYAIPNVEIVRKEEIPKFSIFYKILSPSIVLVDKFKDKSICPNSFPMSYIGHGVTENVCTGEKLKNKYVKDVVKFVHISGLNALERKQTLQVIDAFNLALENTNNIHLTVTVQGNIIKIPEIYEKCKNANIKLIDTHLEHSEIISLYKNSHVSIQVSSHEGLGVGFYESISCSTPVISLDTAPHNEVVKNDVSGWLLPCEFRDLKDNNAAIVQGAYFKTDDLANKIVELSNNEKEINKLIVSCGLFFQKNFTEDLLCERIIDNL